MYSFQKLTHNTLTQTDKIKTEWTIKCSDQFTLQRNHKTHQEMFFWNVQYTH